MRKKLFTIIIGCFALNASADIFDRIDACEQKGGGACVFDLLREVARQHGGHEVNLLDSGTYTSENYRVNVSASGSQIVLSGGGEISERGTYHCTGNECKTTEHSYTFTIENRTSIRMNYGRVWTLQK